MTSYRDAYITADDTGLTIARYYFPLGQAKHIAYERIRRIET